MTAGRNKKLNAEALWNYALRVLGARAYSISELRGKLLGRAEESGDVPEILAKLKEYGYLDDKRFAESFASSRRDSQGFGRFRVLRDLRGHKVAPAVAERAVQSAYKEADETVLIESYLERKYRRVNLGEFLAEPKNLASAYRRLRTAGFGSGSVIRVLKRYAAGTDEIEALESEDSSQESE